MTDTEKARPQPQFSFEYFPPRDKPAAGKLLTVARNLADTAPAFMTVTYGAGGSAQDGTFQTLLDFQQAAPDMPLASHLTYVASSKEKLTDYTDRLWDNGIRHIVALRGDTPKGMDAAQADAMSAFNTTADFVTWLKGRHDFEISVSAYPEKHPKAASLDADLNVLRDKVEAGATRAITQFFFDNDDYYRFVDKAAAKGIHMPIVPGLLPIMNFAGMTKFAAACESKVPQRLSARFNKYANGSDDALKLAKEVLEEQTEDLIRQGVAHIHFYTMNSDRILPSICRNIHAGVYQASLPYKGPKL